MEAAVNLAQNHGPAARTRRSQVAASTASRTATRRGGNQPDRSHWPENGSSQTQPAKTANVGTARAKNLGRASGPGGTRLRVTPADGPRFPPPNGHGAQLRAARGRR